MPTHFDILIHGQPATTFDATLAELEVEENADMPGAFSLSLPVALTSDGDYDTISSTDLAPLSNIAVTARAADGQTHCLIDGYVLAHNAHLDTGTAKSTLKVWGQDASWLMNATEKTRAWPDVTDGQAANSIFGEYNITPDPSNTQDDSAVHSQDSATMMQRGSDAQFLRRLARRSGKLFRVFCTDTAGARTGFFGKPQLDGSPLVTLTLNDASAATVNGLHIAWDVMRPTTVVAQQKLFSDSDTNGAGGPVTDSGLNALDQRALADWTGTPVTALLTTTAADAGTLTTRAQSVLREAGWFVRCEGTADVGKLGAILRAGTVAQLNMAGALHSGNYLVWSVRHHITAQKHEMAFVLVRNAIGPQPIGAGGFGI